MTNALTAEYLYQGIKLLYPDNNQDACSQEFQKIARGVYGLGVVVVAPIGMVYHICAAAWNALQKSCAQDPKALSARMWLHLDALLMDFLAFAMAAVGVTLAICVIAGVFFGAFELLALPLFVLMRSLLLDEDDEQILIPYNYAMNPLTTLNMFLPADQRDSYLVHGLFSNMIRKGAAIEGPLSDQEIGDWARLINRMGSPFASPLDKLLGGPELLLQYDKAPPASKAGLEALTAQRDAFEKAWSESMQESRGSGQALQIFLRKCAVTLLNNVPGLA